MRWRDPQKVFDKVFGFFYETRSLDFVNERALGEYAEKFGISGSYKKILLMIFRNEINMFTLACERGEMAKGCSLYQWASEDARNLLQMISEDKLMELEWTATRERFYPELERLCHAMEAHELIDALAELCMVKGCGDLAYYPMLEANGDGTFTPIEHGDPVRFSDLVGCERQEAILRQNIELFLRGLPAQNMLLTGNRGSGKSSCVKALANEYFEQGLRLVEIGKDKIESLPALLETLRSRGKRFLLFMDDLSYDTSEDKLGRLKSVLEGGARLAPINVLFCATSNRRHLVKETWEDRQEVHTSDAMGEKLSLSDRFGLSVAFPKPTPEEYIEIAVELAVRYQVPLSHGEIRARALSWELGGIGRSGRSARQFALTLKAETNGMQFSSQTPVY
ncbi:MAG: ATP-binding protein [Clostridiales bacterium]|jgi:predicted AAA+ superfamily ATPase|nr:ATP-binding protein [Clostridiales bacterium]